MSSGRHHASSHQLSAPLEGNDGATGATNPGPAASATEFMTNDEVAGLLRVSPRTLEKTRLSGSGPNFFKVGPGQRARVVYRRADVFEWLQQFGYRATAEYTD